MNIINVCTFQCSDATYLVSLWSSDSDPTDTKATPLHNK